MQVVFKLSGMGAILLNGSQPKEYFALDLTTDDLRRFSAKRGESGFTTLWEALTLLICIRQWLTRNALLNVRIKSDSLGALRLAMKLSSSSPRLNQVAQGIALHLAIGDAQISLLEHIPGVTNIQADALSRLTAPEAKSIPGFLSNAKRIFPPNRDSDFWRAWV